MKNIVLSVVGLTNDTLKLYTINTLGIAARDKFLPSNYSFEDMRKGTARADMEQKIRQRVESELKDKPFQILSVSVRTIDASDPNIRAQNEQLAAQLATQTNAEDLAKVKAKQISAVLKEINNEPWQVKVQALMLIFNLPMAEVNKYVGIESQPVVQPTATPIKK